MFSLKPEILFNSIRDGAVDRTSNPTRYPDDFFRSLTPIFLIRHPALVIPSYYKQQRDTLHLEASDECLTAFTTQRFTRLVFDVFRAKAGSDEPPLVIDAKDLVHETMLTMEKLCERLGLDPNGVQYNWSPVPPDQWPNMPMSELGMLFFTDLWGSGRVYGSGEKAMEDTLDLDHETKKWSDEFGEDTAKHLRRLVDEDMPHYEYMKQFKITAF
ncbi:hypothetical protein HII31_12195 [Pseudocercospora fuligena]|uniref:Sulfotransferase domain-containing protein n=1 Tax=Pseudocercospora fuligena TaxID=685502 RepID=A0A8H6VBT9_9PEZI|nr:hypothetical protein HII31_12195 [Pseudocercospora fuligena]